MFCPSDENTGFLQVVGPIQQSDLNTMTIKGYPITITFAPRTTVPSIINSNMLDESTGNSCTYKGKRYNLVNVQICSVVHEGYNLPGQTRPPVAELVLSFSASSTPNSVSDLSGILLCVPIYDSGNPRHNEYIDQLVDPSGISCKYTNESGSEYDGNDYRTLSGASLSKCVKSCCDDPNCLVYTFKSGTCHLKNSVTNLIKTGDSSIISGSIDRNALKKCESDRTSDPNSTAIVSTLESIFYEWDGDTRQSSFAYKTCFETISSSNQPNSKSLYVIVFPNGIHLRSSTYQQLLLILGGSLKKYEVPPAIRGGDSTLYRFEMNDGKKRIIQTSSIGNIYSTPVSSCTDEFKNRFDYFTLPPRTHSKSRSSTSKNGLTRLVSGTFPDSEKCDYYPTTQYKCMPFDQLRDLSGNYVVPGNTTLDEILQQKQSTQAKQNKGDLSVSTSLTTQQIEAIIGGTIGGIIAIMIGYKVLTYISNRPNK